MQSPTAYAKEGSKENSPPTLSPKETISPAKKRKLFQQHLDLELKLTDELDAIRKAFVDLNNQIDHYNFKIFASGMQDKLDCLCSVQATCATKESVEKKIEEMQNRSLEVPEVLEKENQEESIIADKFLV